MSEKQSMAIQIVGVLTDESLEAADTPWPALRNGSELSSCFDKDEARSPGEACSVEKSVEESSSDFEVVIGEEFMDIMLPATPPTDEEYKDPPHSMAGTAVINNTDMADTTQDLANNTHGPMEVSSDSKDLQMAAGAGDMDLSCEYNDILSDLLGDQDVTLTDMFDDDISDKQMCDKPKDKHDSRNTISVNVKKATPTTRPVSQSIINVNSSQKDSSPEKNVKCDLRNISVDDHGDAKSEETICDTLHKPEPSPNKADSDVKKTKSKKVRENRKSSKDVNKTKKSIRGCVSRVAEQWDESSMELDTTLVTVKNMDIHYNIVNITVQTNLKGLAGQQVNIERLHEEIPLSSSLNSNSCQVKFYPSSQVVTVRKSGLMLCWGADDINTAKKKTRQVARFLQKTQFPCLRLGGHQVTSVTGHVNLGFRVNIHKMAEYTEDAFFEPEIDLPCFRFKDKDASYSVCIFSNGKMNINAKSVEVIKNVTEKFAEKAWVFRVNADS